MALAVGTDPCLASYPLVNFGRIGRTHSRATPPNPQEMATLGLPCDGRPRMSASPASSSEPSANPLDIMEQIVKANEWEADRCSDTEMAAEAPGQWCDYGLFFNWSH